jgi:molybdopterin-biosynthesis enzyme MoeA-like protein
MAKFCFQLGIVRLPVQLKGQRLTERQALKRIEVIADDESEIIEAVRRMSDNYDFVVTSGGIGPT